LRDSPSRLAAARGPKGRGKGVKKAPKTDKRGARSVKEPSLDASLICER